MMQNNVLRRLLAALLAVLTLVSFTALPALAAELGLECTWTQVAEITSKSKDI